MFLNDHQLQTFDREGYLVVKQAFDPTRTVDLVFREYEMVLDNLARDLYSKGEISSSYDQLDFDERVIAIYEETQRSHHQYFDFSLPINGDVKKDTPMWHGPEVFSMLTFPDLLDLVESIIGPEIYSNPVQHVRIKPPGRVLQEKPNNPPDNIANHPGKSNLVDATPWHQDQEVGREDSLQDTNMLTAWIPIRDTTAEMGCLKVVPGTHKGEILTFCDPSTRQGPGIPERFFDSDKTTPLPVEKGDVILFHKKTVHGSLDNTSDRVRISFDIRYHPIGQTTGREWFPGFSARSKTDPDSVLKDAVKWDAMWKATREELARHGSTTAAQSEANNLRRRTENPVCA